MYQLSVGSKQGTLNVTVTYVSINITLGLVEHNEQQSAQLGHLLDVGFPPRPVFPSMQLFTYKYV